MQNLEALSLVFLVAVLVLGFWKKVNMGFLAMGAALIIARIGKIPDKTVISSFSTSLFISLVGPAFLFSMAVENGTMDTLAKKILKLVGNRVWAIPLILAVMTFILSAAGCGNIPTFAIMLPLAIALASELKIDVIGIGIIITMACNFGAMSPISNAGIILTRLISETPYSGKYSWEIFYLCIAVWFLFTLAFYFIGKMHKVRNSSIESLKEVHSFDRKQVFTLIACIIVVFVVFVFRVNIGLVAPLAAVILAMIGAGNEKKAIKMMPWGSFILVCGVNMLMGVVRALGGIKLLVAGLNSIMSPSTTNPIMALAGGVMSWFSSTTGVVMPTLIPTIGGILEKFPSSTFCSLAASITISSFLAALSPASTGGAGILAQYAIFTKGEGEQDTNKIFARLFISSVACVLVSVILAFIGFYKIF